MTSMRQSSPIMTKRGCWTCKRRKIWCDRASFPCNNCQASRRECKGYGLRLVWPDQPDKRRHMPYESLDLRQFSHQALFKSRFYGSQFLNTTFEDLHQYYYRDTFPSSVSVSTALLRPSPFPHFLGDEFSLLQYYEDRISGMISTINYPSNGFRSELIPMAISAVGHSSEALRNAILAVSAFHKCGSTEKALKFKAKAVRSLTKSLSYENIGDEATLNSQMAASLMLCVYSVFDETEGNWQSYLNGARAISLHIHDNFDGKSCSQFILTWLTYHEVLGFFSKPPSDINRQSSIDILKHENFDDSIVIGSLGCSIGVLDAIHSLNKMRYTITAGTPDCMTEMFLLERKLLCLKQFLDPIDNLIAQNLDTEEHSKIRNTAELYRLAALLYHYRVCGTYLKRHEERKSYLQQAFQIISNFKVCTSPWPLFVIASEAENDDQRLTILYTLDRMDEARKIGNVFVLRNIIQSLWKQQDLTVGREKGGKESSRLNWSDILSVDFKTEVPWFV